MLVDTTLDECEQIIGNWQPANKFLSLYHKLDDLSDQVDELDIKAMDTIGNRARELNKDLDDIMRRL